MVKLEAYRRLQPAQAASRACILGGAAVLALALSACGNAPANSASDPLLPVGSVAGSAAPSGAATTPPPSAAGAAGTAASSTVTQPTSTGSGSAAAGAPATAPTAGAFCDALGVVRNKCQTCHGAMPLYGAPMSMVAYADFQKPAVTDATEKVYQMISTRIHDSTRPMPPINNPTLDSTELAKLDAWIAGGALAGADPTCAQLPAATTPTTNPAGTGTATAAPPNTTLDADGFAWPNDCEKHYKVLIYSGTQGSGQKQTVAAGKEAHPQISLMPPWPANAQGLAFKPITDNKKVLHHWILYGPDGAFIMGWAPGNTGSQPFPSDVGEALPTGTMRMDVHYNNLGGTTDEQDASGFEVCTIETPSKLRPKLATIEGIIGNANVPAHQHVDNTTSCTVTASMGGEATIISNSPHMHKLGVHAKLVLTPKAGGADQVLRDGDFSFEDQRSYPFNPLVTVKTGDKMTITCSFTNDTDQAVTFGENTENEMCFNFIMVYPKGGFSCGQGISAFPGFPGASNTN